MTRGLRVLLVTPPMVQLNTPYPATAYLTGFLRQHAAALNLELAQADPALELFLRLFSRAGLERVRGFNRFGEAGGPARDGSCRSRRSWTTRTITSRRSTR